MVISYQVVNTVECIWVVTHIRAKGSQNSEYMY